MILAAAQASRDAGRQPVLPPRHPPPQLVQMWLGHAKLSATAELLKTIGTVVDKLRTAFDREPLHEEAFQRILDLARYTTVEGRHAFLTAMKLPGADAEGTRSLAGPGDRSRESQACVVT